MSTAQALRLFTHPDDRMVGQWLLIALVSMLLGAVTGIGFFAVGGIFAPLSDAASVMIGLSLIPVALGLDRLFHPFEPRLSRRAMRTGVAGLSLFAAGGLLLVLYHTLFGWLPEALAFGVQFLGILIQGIWLVMVGVLTLRSGVFDRSVGWAAAASGSAYLLMCISFPFDPGGPAVIMTALVAVVCFCAWAIWARAALRDAVTIQQDPAVT